MPRDIFEICYELIDDNKSWRKKYNKLVDDYNALLDRKEDLRLDYNELVEKHNNLLEYKEKYQDMLADNEMLFFSHTGACEFLTTCRVCKRHGVMEHNGKSK